MDAGVAAVRELAASDPERPLTLVDFGDGAITRALLPLDGLEEAVVVSSSSAAASSRPDGASSWVMQCKAAQLFSLRAALLKAARPRIVVAASAGLPASHQLRLVQLFSSLPTCTSLLLVDPTPPAIAERTYQKAVFRVDLEDAAAVRLTTAMLPRDASDRRRAWREWLAGAVAAGDGKPRCELQTAAVGCYLLVAHKSVALPPPPPDETGGASKDTRPPASRDEIACHFPPPILSVTDQLAELRRRVDAMVAANEPAELTRLSSGLDEAGDRVRVRLVPSTSERFVSGGYAELHYVTSAPDEHGTSYELERITTAGSSLCAERIGYISLLAYGCEEPAKQFPTAVRWRSLHAAQVDRLVVKPEWRGSGAKEALLGGACAPYAALGYAVRVKTASSSVHESFMRCSLLSYEGHRAAGTTCCGVRRPMKRFARVLPPAAEVSRGLTRPQPTPDDDSRDYDRCWRLEGCEGGDDKRSSGEGDNAKVGCSVSGQASAASAASATSVASVASTASTAASPPNAVSAVSTSRALLNKLTADSFERIVPQLAATALTSDASLECTLQLLFRRACHEPIYCSLYASVCARLADSSPPHIFREAVKSALLSALSTCDSPANDHGSGSLIAELTRRQLVDPSQVLVDALLAGPTGRLCAYAARAGPDLHRREPLVLARLVGAVEKALDAGDASSGALRAECREVLEAHRRSWPDEPDTDARRGEATLSISAVRAEAAAELGLVLAPRDTPDAAVRGLREGWIHWYVGAPIVHPESGEVYNFDEAAGRIVELNEN